MIGLSMKILIIYSVWFEKYVIILSLSHILVPEVK